MTLFSLGKATRIPPRFEHNLWIIDERLNFTSYVSSDVPLNGEIMSNLTCWHLTNVSFFVVTMSQAIQSQSLSSKNHRGMISSILHLRKIQFSRLCDT